MTSISLDIRGSDCSFRVSPLFVRDCVAPQVLGRGAGFPVVGCYGSAKVRLNFKGPFMWRPQGSETVHTSFHVPGSRSKQPHGGKNKAAVAPAPATDISAAELMGALEDADRVRFRDRCAR